MAGLQKHSWSKSCSPPSWPILVTYWTLLPETAKKAKQQETKPSPCKPYIWSSAFKPMQCTCWARDPFGGFRSLTGLPTGQRNNCLAFWGLRPCKARMTPVRRRPRIFTISPTPRSILWLLLVFDTLTNIWSFKFQLLFLRCQSNLPALRTKISLFFPHECPAWLRCRPTILGWMVCMKEPRHDHSRSQHHPINSVRVIWGIDYPAITQVNFLGMLKGKAYPSETCACKDLEVILWEMIAREFSGVMFTPSLPNLVPWHFLG